MAEPSQLTVVGVFHDRQTAQQAVDDLHAAGFPEDDIGFAMRDAGAVDGGSTHSAGEGGAGSGAVAGMLTGGVVGGIAAAAVSLLVPGIGPVIGGGILATVLGGAAAGAAAGGVLGALVGMGVPEEEARYYDQEFAAGRAIVTVRAGTRYQEASAILGRHGGYDAQRRTETPSLDPERVRAYAAHPVSAATEDTAVRQGATAAGTDAGSVKDLRPFGTRDAASVRSDAEADTEELPRQARLQGNSPDMIVETDTQTQIQGLAGGYSIADAERATDQRQPSGPSGSGQRQSSPEMPSGHSPTWPARADDTMAGKFVEDEEEISTTTRGGTDTLIVSPSGHARARDAAQASGPYIDPSEDLERVGATSGLAPNSQVETWSSAEPRYRQRWQASAPTGGSWDSVAGGYRFGHEMAADQRFQGRSWHDCERDLEHEYRARQQTGGGRHAESGWEQVRDSARDAWQAAGRN